MVDKESVEWFNFIDYRTLKTIQQITILKIVQAVQYHKVQKLW